MRFRPGPRPSEAPAVHRARTSAPSGLPLSRPLRPPSKGGRLSAPTRFPTATVPPPAKTELARSPGHRAKRQGNRPRSRPASRPGVSVRSFGINAMKTK